MRIVVAVLGTLLLLGLLANLAAPVQAYPTSASGTITVSPGTTEYVYFSTPGSYSETYHVILSWTITNFADDEVFVGIYTYPDGGYFANSYNEASGYDDSAWSGDTDFRFAVNNQGSQTLYVTYSISTPIWESGDDGTLGEDDQTSGLCCCTCCTGIVMWVAPVAGAAFLSTAPWKRLRR